MKYILNREATRVVQRNEKGTVTYRKRYKKGDVVDVSYIDPTQVENLVASGAFTVEDDGEDDTEETEGPESPDEDPKGSGDGTDGQDDGYDAMSYADLQAEAKSRDINAGGSADELRERLRAFDEDAE